MINAILVESRNARLLSYLVFNAQTVVGTSLMFINFITIVTKKENIKLFTRVYSGFMFVCYLIRYFYG